jgi:RNA polymerase-binding transcription factor DksA
LSTIDVEHLERRLLEERERTLESIQQAEAEERGGLRASAGEVARIPSSLADAASDTQEEEKDWANINRESEQLARIDEALRLLKEDPGAYGQCEACGREIGVERLELVPWARRCAQCAEE